MLESLEAVIAIFVPQPHGLAGAAAAAGRGIRCAAGPDDAALHADRADQRGVGEGAARLQQGLQHARRGTVPKLCEYFTYC